MGYLTYTTQAEAEQQEQLLSANIRAWIATNYPERIAENGLISIDTSGQLQPTATVTTKWADVIEGDNDRFAFVCPTQDDLKAVPLDVALQGITGVYSDSFTPKQSETPF
jgi:hypothetical protein